MDNRGHPMTTRSRLRSLAPTLCLIAGLAAFGSGLAQDGGLEITNTAYQEVEVKADDGTVTTRLVPAARVVPGDEVVFEIAYVNTGSEAATDIAIDNPVPPQVSYQGAAGTPVTAVSVDGGESFGALDSLTVLGADGAPRPATASDVTNLRWIIESLAPGASGKVSFRARVK